MGEIGTLWIKIGAKMEGLDKAVTDIDKATKKIADRLGDIGKQMTIVGGAITGALLLVTKKTADYGDKIWDLHQKTGIASETLTGFKLAADQTGTSLEGMATGFRKLADNMVDANNGTGTAKQLFDALGISVNDSSGNLRSMDDVLLDVATCFSNMADGALKNKLAVELFGKAGTELIPMLNLGAEGLRAARARAEELGIVLTDQAAKACDEFNDQLAELTGAAQGAGMTIGTMLMPAVQSLIDKVANIVVSIRAWADEHPALSAGLITAAAAVGGLFVVLGPILMMLPKLVAGFQLLKGALSTSVTAIGAVAVAAGVAYVALNAMIDAKNRATDAAYEASEADRRLGLMLREATDAIGMNRAEFQQLYQQYGESNKVLAKWIRFGWEGKELQDALTEVTKKHADALKDQNTGLANVDAILAALNPKTETLAKELDLITKSAIATEIKKYETALISLRDNLPTSEIERIKEKIKELREQLSRTSTEDIIKELRSVQQQMIALGNSTPIPTREIQRLRERAQELWTQLRDTSLATGEFNRKLRELYDTTGLLPGKFEEIGIAARKMAYDSAAAVEGGLITTLRDEVPSAAEKARKGIKDKVGSAISEVSTIFADAMRNIGRSIAGALGLIGLFSFKAMKFDDSYYRDMVDAASRAYDELRRLSDEQFSAEELAIRRREQDEDIAYKREYDRQRKAIMDSAMTQEEKEAALLALETKYEDEKLARERKREDEKLAREKAHQAALLAMALAHEKEVQALRDAEDKARQKHADDEEKRQNSLWMKVKGIFGTAIGEMATLWITKLITPIGDEIGKFFGSLFSKSKKAGDDIADGVGGGVKGLGKTVGEVAKSIGTVLTTLAEALGTVLTTLATALGTVITTLATAIGTALVTLATAIASAATILAAAAPEIAIVLAIFLAAYAAFLAIQKLFGGGASQTDVTYWLKLISDNMKEVHDWLFINAQDKLNFYVQKFNEWHQIFSDIREKIDTVNDTGYQMRDWLQQIAGDTEAMVGILDNLSGAQYGAVVTKPSLVSVAEHGSEAIVPLGNFKGGGGETNVSVQIRPLVIPRKDSYEIQFLVETIKHMSKHEQMQIHPNSVRAY